jgi:hypothetical protein
MRPSEALDRIVAPLVAPLADRPWSGVAGGLGRQGRDVG